MRADVLTGEFLAAGIYFSIARRLYGRIKRPIQKSVVFSRGPMRSGESGFGRIPLFPYTAPYEDITMKAA